jgi:16S rRNA (guanine966-N2)-methyltransferase
MRIIAGRFKGHSLYPVSGDKVRSTADRVKESLFNIIVGEPEDAEVLDLFCGAGTLGLEALSRGAAHVTFVDLSRRSVDRARANLEALGAGDEGDFLVMDATAVLRVLERNNRRFSLILADPPYGMGWPGKILQAIGASGCLAPTGVLVIEYHKKDPPGGLPPGFSLWTERRFGDTMFAIWQWSSPAEPSSPAGLPKQEAKDDGTDQESNRNLPRDL